MVLSARSGSYLSDFTLFWLKFYFSSIKLIFRGKYGKNFFVAVYSELLLKLSDFVNAVKKSRQNVSECIQHLLQKDLKSRKNRLFNSEKMINSGNYILYL